MFNKAQSSAELIMLIGFVLFFFTVFFLVVQENVSDKIREKNNLAVKEIASIVQDEIALASESSDGYSRQFKLPEKIENQDYDINITEDMVYVKTQNDKYATSLPILAITGAIVKGDNKIKKESGEVKLNEE